jgi:hypothetical protein
VKAAIACVELSRAVANSAELRAFTKREVMPGNLKGVELERLVRDAASSYWHQTGTAKMGQDAMSVVDGTLKVYGIERLRIADGSIMPRVTTGNTQAPASSSASEPSRSCEPSIIFRPSEVVPLVSCDRGQGLRTMQGQCDNRIYRTESGSPCRSHRRCLSSPSAAR